jgi:outer membrane immunogenic protein
MRRSLQLLMFSLIFFTPGVSNRARAQAVTVPESSKVDIFSGYSYLHATTVISGAPINLHGASFSAAFYVNRWLGLVGDTGVYHAGNIAQEFDVTLWSYQFGPRVRLPNHTRFTPYAQFLPGGGHAGGTIYTSSLGPGLAPIGTNNSFLLTVGGGLDCRLNHRIGIRIVQAEYLYSEFLNGSAVGHKQNNLRLSTGVVFNFGKT